MYLIASETAVLAVVHIQRILMAKQLSFDFYNLSKFSFKQYFQDAGKIEASFNSSQGVLFEADCLKVLPNIKDEIADVIFADPLLI